KHSDLPAGSRNVNSLSWLCPKHRTEPTQHRKATVRPSSPSLQLILPRRTSMTGHISRVEVGTHPEQVDTLSLVHDITAEAAGAVGRAPNLVGMSTSVSPLCIFICTRQTVYASRLCERLQCVGRNNSSPSYARAQVDCDPVRMSEDGSAPTPQVFVVDSQASYLSMPRSKKSTWAGAGQKFLPLLLALLALAVFVEGYLIYILYQRTEAFSGCVSNNLCHNVSDPVKSEQQNGRTSSQIGTQESIEMQLLLLPLFPQNFIIFHIKSNEIPPLQPQKRPFAHMMGAHKSHDTVVEWKSQGHDMRRRMEYSNSRLVIKQEGYYYVYSKLVVDVSEATSPIFHKIVRNPSGYATSIDLLKSKSNWGPEKSSDGAPGEDKWRSFLSAIFFLQEGDEIYVTLSNMEALSPEANENCLGAIWIDS
ncbi:hypothetical protein CCH79_00014273, partial [Gambusia affinis]